MTIKNDITTEIDTLIGSMTTPTYNYNYNNINQYKPQNKTYPAVKTMYPEEEYLDPDEQVVDSYSSNLRATFEITVDNTEEVRLSLTKVQEDFQRLLEANHVILQGKGMILGDLLSNIREYFQVRQRPGMITMEWNIFYRVKRSDPAETI